MRKFAVIAALISVLTFSGCTNEGNFLSSTTATEPNVSNSSVSTGRNYIANRNSGKLHSSSCDSLPYEENRIYFGTIEEAHAAGYTDHHRECMGG